MGRNFLTSKKWSVLIALFGLLALACLGKSTGWGFERFPYDLNEITDVPGVHGKDTWSPGRSALWDSYYIEKCYVMRFDAKLMYDCRTFGDWNPAVGDTVPIVLTMKIRRDLCGAGDIETVENEVSLSDGTISTVEFGTSYCDVKIFNAYYVKPNGDCVSLRSLYSSPMQPIVHEQIKVNETYTVSEIHDAANNFNLTLVLDRQTEEFHYPNIHYLSNHIIDSITFAEGEDPPTTIETAFGAKCKTGPYPNRAWIEADLEPKIFEHIHKKRIARWVHCSELHEAFEHQCPNLSDDADE